MNRFGFRSLGRMIMLAAGIMLGMLPLAPNASAHAYSAGYTTLSLTKSQTEITYTLDELSVIELAGGDLDDNLMLDDAEFNQISEPLIKVLKENLIFSLGGQAQVWTKLEGLQMERKGDGSKIVLKAVYPAVSAFQSISFKDTLYMQDKNTNYVDLLTIRYGPGNSTAALSGDSRTWALQLTDADYAGLAENAGTSQSGSSSADGTSGGGVQSSDSANSQPQDEAAEGSASYESSASGWFSFFTLGMHHILGGYDHLLFLFSLLIARQTFKQYAMMITAFTVAHSLTLTLTVLGILNVPPQWVEPAIALSICYVALDNIVRSNVSGRWVLTFLFGLIHGMGFADLLKEMDLPRNQLAADLINFNLGIETVQLAIVSLCIPLLMLLHRHKHARRVIIAASCAAFALGGAWLIERML
ncbi:HupE / UreJ protein [compost metagenome]